MSKLISDLGTIVNVEGGNMEANEGRLCLASDFYKNMEPTPTFEDIEIMRQMEERWLSIFKSENLSKVSSLQIVNGKVSIPDGSPYHNLMYPTLDRIKSISKYGVLCSENFGILESQFEGRFCAFVSKTSAIPLKGFSRGGINFYFDTKNPIIQGLLNLDYFEYESKKQKGESLEEYPKVVRDFLDKIIEPLSPYGKDMRKYDDCVQYLWSAIPFGLPPELINGIEIKQNALNKTDCSLDQLAQLFPKAVIFDKNKNVLRRSLQSEETISL